MAVMGGPTLTLSAKEWAESVLVTASERLAPGARKAIESLIADEAYDAAASFALEYALEAGALTREARETAEQILKAGGFGRSEEWVSELLAA
jgi:hypothetical protein